MNLGSDVAARPPRPWEPPRVLPAGMRLVQLGMDGGGKRHVNIHPFCLHLFHCLHGDVTPDFTRGSGSL